MKRAVAPLVWAILSVPIAVSVVRQGDPGDRSPVWDVASHALNGLRLADSISRLDPVSFGKELILPHHYPPGHSVFQAPFYWVLGRTHAASRVSSAVGLVLLVGLAVLWAVRAGADPVFAPMVILAAAASSPRLLMHAAVPMLELFGALGFVLFAALYLRSLEAPDDLRRAIWAGAAATMVYLTTVNYAIILFAGVAVYEFVRGDARAGLRALREFWIGYRPINPWAGAVLACLATAWVVRITGGWQYGSIRLQSPRAPVSIAIAIVALHLAVELWKRREKMRRWPSRLKGAFWATLVPITVWFALYPPRIRTTLDFLEGGGVSPMSWQDRFFLYPRLWVGEYHLSAPVAIGGVLALAITLATWRRQKEAARFLSVLALTATLAIYLHPMRDPRFLVAVLPLYWILLASQIGFWTDRRWWLSGGASLLFAASAWQAWRHHREELQPRIQAAWYGNPGSAHLTAFAVHDVGEKPSMRLIGSAHGLSWHAIEFEVRRHRTMRGFRFEKDLPHTAKSRRSTGEIFARWLSKEPEDRVVTIEPPSTSWRGDVAEDVEYVRLLGECGRYRLAREDAATVPGIRVRVWDRMR